MLDRTKDIAATAQSWLDDFERACAAPDSTPLARLFVADSYWRDALALSWNLKARSPACSSPTAIGATRWP